VAKRLPVPAPRKSLSFPPHSFFFFFFLHPPSRPGHSLTVYVFFLPACPPPPQFVYCVRDFSFFTLAARPHGFCPLFFSSRAYFLTGASCYRRHFVILFFGPGELRFFLSFFFLPFSGPSPPPLTPRECECFPRFCQGFALSLLDSDVVTAGLVTPLVFFLLVTFVIGDCVSS